MEIGATLTPTADVAVPISFGFHPYLRLPGSQRGDWQISLPVRRRLVLDARSLPSGHSEQIPDGISGALGERTFYDCYDRLASPRLFALADGRRRVELELGDGYDVAQVFAPPASDFICFEPMTAPIDALHSGDGLRLAWPGEPFAATFTVTASMVS
jgi:aldose 1-epimerase